MKQTRTLELIFLIGLSCRIHFVFENDEFIFIIYDM